MLEIGDDLRYGCVRDIQLRGSLAEAPRLHNGEENAQVT